LFIIAACYDWRVNLQKREIKQIVFIVLFFRDWYSLNEVYMLFINSLFFARVNISGSQALARALSNQFKINEVKLAF